MSNTAKFMKEGECMTPTERETLAKLLTREQIALHRQYVVDNASDHDDDCPEDDTCDCSMKPRNDAVNAVCRYLAALASERGAETELSDGQAKLVFVTAWREGWAAGKASGARPTPHYLDAIDAWEKLQALTGPAVEPPVSAVVMPGSVEYRAGRCSCWLGTDATYGSSRQREACAVHGLSKFPGPAVEPPVTGVDWGAGESWTEAVVPPAPERHHDQCPWQKADPQRLRSVCGCPPGWPKPAPEEKP